MTSQPNWDEHLRMSDAEREQAATALGEHYAQGRLTTEEHSERLDQIWAAKTRAELTPIFRDLPGPASQPPPRPSSASAAPRRAPPARCRCRCSCCSGSWSPSRWSPTCR